MFSCSCLVLLRFYILYSADPGSVCAPRKMGYLASVCWRFIHSFIQAITIAPLPVHYYSEVLPTQHGCCVGISGLSVTDNCEWRTFPRSLADPDLQKQGGQIFDEIFERPFLGISWTNFCIPQKIPHYFPKFLMTFFLVIDLFHVLMCNVVLFP